VEAILPSKLWGMVYTSIHMLSALPWYAPLGVLAVCAGIGYAAESRRDRAAARWRAGILLAGAAGDGLALAALPWLGISFGPVGFPWLAMVFIRLGLAGAIQLPRLNLRRGAAAIKLGLFGAASLALLVVEVYGLYIEPLEVTVTQRTIVLPGLALAARPLRIVQLSDLHIERLTPRETAMLATVQALKPDLIVLTGDYLNLSYLYDPQARQAARAVMGQLHAPYGVYAIRGTLDNDDVTKALFSGLDNVAVLDNTARLMTVDGRTLYLAGVTTTTSMRLDRQVLARLMQAAPPDAQAILLYHTPDLIEAAQASGVDLYLAGHTHGGQIRLPWFGAVVTASRYGKRYEAGYYQAGPTQLYVSRGLGLEGLGAPRARFLCPPEVVALEVQ
jgi:predicted MPP superfamily phosphohydrolase